MGQARESAEPAKSSEPVSWVHEVVAALSAAIADDDDGGGEAAAEHRGDQAWAKIEQASGAAVRAQPTAVSTIASTSVRELDAPVALRTVADPGMSAVGPKIVTLPFEAPDGGIGRLRVAVVGDQVRATMLVEPSVVATLELGLPELRRNLEARGFGDPQLAVRAAGVDAAPVLLAGGRNEPGNSAGADHNPTEQRTAHPDPRRDEGRHHRRHPDEEAE